MTEQQCYIDYAVANDLAYEPYSGDMGWSFVSKDSIPIRFHVNEIIQAYESHRESAGPSDD